VVMHRDGQDFLGCFLTDHVLVELSDDLTGGGNVVEELLGGTLTPLFLIEDRLAQVDTFPADVNVAGPSTNGPTSR